MSERKIIGNIYEIPLPNGKKAFGRLFKSGVLGIYTEVYNDYSELPKEEKYQFYVAVYADLLSDGEWQVVGRREFENEEAAWPPDMVVVDQITHKGSLYRHDRILPCSFDECKDLEIAAVWDRHHVIDRIMGDKTWLELMARPEDV